MSFSYGGDPSDPLDRVRFFLNDRQPPGRLMDEEIEWLLSAYPNVYIAAAYGAEQIAAQLGTEATSKTVGGLSITKSAPREAYTALACTLRGMAFLQLSDPVSAGGLSKGEKLDQLSDTDAVQPIFRKPVWPRVGRRAGTFGEQDTGAR